MKVVGQRKGLKRIVPGSRERHLTFFGKKQGERKPHTKNPHQSLTLQRGLRGSDGLTDH